MSQSVQPNESGGLPRWIFILVVLLLIAFVLLWAYILHRKTTLNPAPLNPQQTQTRGVLPDPARTPGDVLTTDTRQICSPGYTQTMRNVPEAIKRQVYQEYGILSHNPGEYEVDHLISLELGGSNSIRNLWPESYISKPLNAHVKDAMENKLHQLVCAGKLPIQEAQRMIAQDWTAAYQRYVGPLPR